MLVKKDIHTSRSIDITQWKPREGDEHILSGRMGERKEECRKRDGKKEDEERIRNINSLHKRNEGRKDKSKKSMGGFREVKLKEVNVNRVKLRNHRRQGMLLSNE